MQHSDHLAEVVLAIAEDRPVAPCPDCEVVVGNFTVAGEPIKMETL